MKFRILLYILGKKLIKKTGTSTEFKKKLAEKDCIVQIKTADNKKGRYFKIAGGNVTSTGGIAPEPTVSLTWKDAATAVAVLTSSDESKKMQALQDGSLKLEGDAMTALWFTEAMKMLKK